MFLFSMLFLFGNTIVSAQSFQIKRSHAIATPSSAPVLPAVGTLDVVAVMVEFQADSNELTSGTGVFGPDGFEGLGYLSRQEDTRIDPLPHDRSYFEAHLEFARNYYARSSDDQLEINYQVLPQVYKLDQPMEAYSPIGAAPTNEKLAYFLRDVWTKVEEQGGFDATGLDPDSTAFVVFHAGVGRDIELTGTSLDITPFDLPSIYMREDNLEQWLGNDFDGFLINNGSFQVKNSMIIPRTESRRGEDIADNEIVFPLSINGLLCASIGSHLGLPDLFNTETGDPAIGRFGLMDGAGFFSYNGLFPPEPSAWEKIYLGWEMPFDITTATTGDINLPHGSGDQPNSITRYALSSTEYFLVENRHRDPEGDGVTLTIRRPDGTEVQQIFTNEDTGFTYQESGFDSLLEAGTLIDVDNFDWSLPGGLDVGDDGREGTGDDRFLNGGMLIWHIDEAVIDQQLMSGKVNADPQRRGVDLEEGDGAQDIGLDAGLLDNSPSFGFAFDFWWSGNNYRVITSTSTIDLNPDNIFGPDTYPNNNSNSGALSFFEFYDFSDNLPVASFRVREVSTSDIGYKEVFSVTQENESFVTRYVDYYPLSMAVQVTDTDTMLVVPAENDIYLYDHVTPVPNNGITFQATSYQQPLILDSIIVAYDPLVYDPIVIRSISNWTATVSPNKGFISSQDGEIIDIDFTLTSIASSDGSVIQNTSGFEFRSEILNNRYVGINGNTVSFVGENIPDYISDASNRLFAGTIQSNLGNYYYLFEDGRFTLIEPSLDDPFVPIFEEEKAEWPAIIDNLQIFRINRSESTIEGYNSNGSLLSNTPISSPDSIQFIGTPLIADITGDNIQDILVVGQDDYSVNIYAYEMTGDPIAGFPLYVGGAEGADIQPVHPFFFDNILYAVSHTGDLRAWEFTEFTTSQWPSRYGTGQNNKVTATINIEENQGQNFSVLNAAETYNWPNPADEFTNIRFQLEAPGIVEITIIDYTGRVIFERTFQANGNVPEEIQVTTSNWGSGAYFANVKATVDGRSESRLIKIGVIH